MKKMTSAFLAAALGVAALWGAAPASAAPGEIQVPPVAGSDLTEYAYLQGAPIQTAAAPGSYLREEDTYVIDEVTFESGKDRIFKVSEPFLDSDGAEWRAVTRWWKDEGTGMSFEPMFIPEEAVKKILTEEEYYATFIPEGGASTSASAAPSAAPAAAAATRTPEAAAQGAQTSARDESPSPVVPWIIAVVLLAVIAGAYVVMRRRKQAGTQSSAEPGA